MSAVPVRPSAVSPNVEWIGKTSAQVVCGTAVDRLRQDIGSIKLEFFRKSLGQLELNTVIGAGEAVIQIETACSIDTRQERRTSGRVGFRRKWSSTTICARNKRGGIERPEREELPAGLANVTGREGIALGQLPLEGEVPFLNVSCSEAVLADCAP